MSGVFAMEDEQRLSRHRCLEQLGGKQFLVIVIDSSIDVAAIVLVLESAINDHFLVKLVRVLSVEDLQQRLLCDPRDRIRGVVGQEVRQHWLMSLFNGHDRVHCSLG